MTQAMESAELNKKYEENRLAVKDKMIGNS